MTPSKDEIAARVDALAQAHEGDEFVAAVERLADELGPEGRPALQEVLMERAADEEDFQQALRERVKERGWTRRTLARFDRLRHEDRADAVADAVAAGPAGTAALERELEALRQDRGKAALVFDELSRSRSRAVRAWVPGAAVDVLDDGARRLVLPLTRDREREVRDAAVTALVGLGPEAAKPIVPDLRKRLHADDPEERIAAMSALGELGDRSAISVLVERAETAQLPEERSAAERALRLVGGR